MQKMLLTLVAMLALAGPAMAGAEAHLTADLNGEVHTVDAYVGDDGSATILVDGEPVSAPAVPEAPATPEIPTLP